jgi:RND superfamily putative drug exporter
VVASEGSAQQVLDKVKAADGVGDAYLLADRNVPITGAPGTPADPAVREGRVLINATLNSAADSIEAEKP